VTDAPRSDGDASDGDSASGDHPSTGREGESEDGGVERPRRAADGDVLVPIELYKIVMVFSTLLAVGLVVAGFAVLDVATRRATAPLDDVNPLLAVVGAVVIGLGAAVYVFSTRFRTEGMGSPKRDRD